MAQICLLKCTEISEGFVIYTKMHKCVLYGTVRNCNLIEYNNILNQ